ncbi:MAG: nucleotidyltransferase family protein [Candidatus Eremiobacteraeota bacterium]|nr:nucleotidyltransferase family protein [Candidatus Eremiobacteraeota bacterium]
MISAQTQARLVRVATKNGSSARIAMRGASMLPSLHEPMVLQIGALLPRPKPGQIVIFDAGSRLVAHRVIAVSSNRVLCCGDASGTPFDDVPISKLLGLVVAIYASGEPGAARVDTLFFKVRGRFFASKIQLRLCIEKLGAFKAAALTVMPWRRARNFTLLTHLMGAICRGESSQARELLQTCDLASVALVAKRHRCAAILSAWLNTLEPEASAQLLGLKTALEPDRFAASIRTSMIRTQIIEIVKLLSEHGVHAVLLKGAARMYTGVADWNLHDSSDIDILLEPSEIERAVRLLIANGYRHQHAANKSSFYDSHRHVAPLYPKGKGAAVELHRAISAPGELSTPLDYASLQKYFVRVDQSAGDVSVFNYAGAALHLLVHGHIRIAFRDIVLIAEGLRNMDASARESLKRIIDEEKRQPARLGAVLYTAAVCAGLDKEFPPSRAVLRAFRWSIVREDLPRPLRARPELLDEFFARDSTSFVKLVRLACGGFSAKRAVATVATGLTTFVYLWLMKSGFE